MQEGHRPAHHGSTLLIQALEHQAVERRHGAKDLARSLGIHVSHWYRMRKSTRLLANSDRRVLERVASYLRWPVGRVYVAAGIIAEQELQAVVSASEAEDTALAQLGRSPLAAGVSTPISTAAPDHRRLMATLYLALQSAALREAKPSA